MSETDKTPNVAIPDEATSAEPPRGTDAEWAALAASLGATKGARTADRASPPPAPTGINRAVFFSSLSFVLALVAIMVAGMLWWQYRAFYVSLDSTDTAAAASLERVRAEQRGLQDKLKDVNEDVDTLRQLNSSVNDRVDALPSRFVELERRLDAVQGGSFDARGDLLRSEAEYYLSVANTELALSGDWDNAIKALELADGRLAEFANPQFGPVREAIAGELIALRSVRLPDVEGLVFSLSRLAARADTLPLRADTPANYSERTAAPDAEPGLARLWQALKRTLLGLVRVERRDAPVAPALQAAERLLAKRQLGLELELARIAVLRAEPQALQTSLQAATDLLRRDFDVESADVDGALALLREMQTLDVAPKRPDIGGSLNLLREIAAGAR